MQNDDRLSDQNTAITRELSARNEALEEKERLLAAFQGVGEITLASLDLAQILNDLPQKIIEAGIFRSLMIALVDEASQTVEVVRNYICMDEDGLPSCHGKPRLIAFHRSDGRSEEIIGLRHALDDEAWTARCARTGEMLVITGFGLHLDRAPQARTDERKVAYFIPVKKENRVLAVLATGSAPEEEELMRLRIRAMQPLLSQVAIALEHARLYEDIRTRVTERRRMEDLLRFQRDLAAELDASSGLEDGLRICMDAVLQVSEMDCGGICLVDEGEPRVVIHRNISAAVIDDAAQCLTTTSLTRLEEPGKPIYANREDLRAAGTRCLQDESVRSLAILPMRHQGRIVACLSVASRCRDDVPANARAALEALAAQISGTITRLRAEDALRASEANYRRLVEINPHIIYQLDADGVITFISKEISEIIGCSADDLLGRHMSVLLHQEDMDKMRHVNEQRTGRRAIRRLELRLVHQSEATDVEVRWVGVNATGVYEAGYVGDGRVESKGLAPRFLGTHGTITDITDRKRMEGDLRRVQNLESLGLLAGGIAHDFNNVLTGVTGNLALLARLLDSHSEEHEIASDAQQAAATAKGLTQQLMTFAKGGTPIRESASIQALLEETTRLSLHGANTRPVFRFPEDLSSVEMDVGQISQAIQNLVLNADQAMPHGGTLRVSADNVEVRDGDPLPLTPGSYVKVTIADEGIGISPDLLSQIFDPYFTTKTTGHGLGLSISYSVIQRHHGHLGVTSEVGTGTTFECYLPAASEPPVATRLQEKEIPVGAGRILLMDDEEIIHRTVSRTLKVLGYQVKSVRGGREALKTYGAALNSEAPFDLVIMDLTIPGGMGGKEAVRELQKLDPSARVIVSSGYANDPVMAHFADHGFAGRVAKPVDLRELAETVREVMATRA